MKGKTSKRMVRTLGLGVALLVSTQGQAADTANGLRVVSFSQVVSADTTRVETRVSRGLSNRLLSPQQLRVAIIGADGSVRAEQRRTLGPAQLARGSARDVYVKTEINAVAGPDERLDVAWVTPGR